MHDIIGLQRLKRVVILREYQLDEKALPSTFGVIILTGFPSFPYCLREGVGGRVKKRKKRIARFARDPLEVTAQRKSLAPRFAWLRALLFSTLRTSKLGSG